MYICWVVHLLITGNSRRIVAVVVVAVVAADYSQNALQDDLGFVSGLSFSDSLDLSPGRLVAASAASRGRAFAVCSQARKGVGF